MEKFSLVDYDSKVCCTLFAEGCNFRCPFCQNSSLVLPSKNDYISESDIFDYLEKRKKLVDAVTISGGEPTLYPDLTEFIYKIKNMGFLIKLDTNGTAPELLHKLIDQQMLDYVAMDIKSGRSSYAKATGIAKYDTTKVEQSVELLKNSAIDYEFRTTLVAELVDEADILDISTWLAGAKKYFLQHFTDSGSCIAPNLHDVPIEKALEYKRLLEKNISCVKLRGY